MEDAGALPIECPVDSMNMGDAIDIYPYKGEITRHNSDEVISKFELKTDVLLDEVRAGGRIPLIIGRGLTEKARQALGLGHSTLFRKPTTAEESGKGYIPAPEDGRSRMRC